MKGWRFKFLLVTLSAAAACPPSSAWAQLDFIEHTIVESTADMATGAFAADLDGDGDMDLLSASDDDDKIAWYENTDGLGTFGPQQIITTEADMARDVHAADLDGDGDMDVLSASRRDDKIAWYENLDGLGTFGPQQIITTWSDLATDVYAADLDGDGDMDVLSASYGTADTSAVSWYENRDGLGDFGPRLIISTEVRGASAVYAADIDGDGDLDVLSASVSDDKVAWYENLGSGVFGPQQIISSVGDGANDVTAADMDGDGDIDVVSCAYFGDEIWWHENTDGLGTFLSRTINHSVDAARSVHVADIDGDTDMDVMFSGAGDDEIGWHENTDGLGTFGTQQIITTDAEDAQGLYAADLDGDGDLDALSASLYDDKVAWYENTDGLGTFGPQMVVTIISIGRDPNSVRAADLDGDGDLDVVATFDHTGIAWFENTDGRGAYVLSEMISTPSGQLREVFTADLDGDGDLDVLTTSAIDDEIAWHENTDGLGTFGAQRLISTSVAYPWTVRAADLDGDGDMDVLSLSVSGDEIGWFENTDGLGTFGSWQIISDLPDSPRDVHAADVDGDGDLDVLSASAVDDTIAWYENTDGFGTFGRQQVINAGSSDGAISVYTADVDGDGDLDVLSASYEDDEIAWYENSDGLGTFVGRRLISRFADHVQEIYTADLDNDGDVDVLSASSLDDEIAWYENLDGLGSFHTGRIISNEADSAYSVFAADLDGDGDVDVLSASVSDDKVAWYENERECDVDADCGHCERCSVEHWCVYQVAGDDLRDQCADAECRTGACDGAGGCGVSPAGTACGSTADTDCDNPDICDGAGVCQANYEAWGVSCDDGVFCNGTDRCDSGGSCSLHVGDPCAGMAGCDEAADSCIECLVDTDCDDGVFCNGEETCNVATETCEAGIDPCASGSECNNFCNESTADCFSPEGTTCTDTITDDCLTAGCDGAGACTQGYASAPAGSDCDDGTYCNGADTCDATGSCTTHAGDPCAAPTVCDEAAGACAGCLLDEHCDDGLFCNGAETCDLATHVCAAGIDPCVSGGECNDHCNEEGDSCFSPDGTTCTDTTIADCLLARCDGAGACDQGHTPAAAESECDDGLFCNGADSCDDSGGCTTHAGDPCPEESVCDPELNACVGCLADGDCPVCQKCDDEGVCVNQSADEDLKDECSAETCATGYCDGAGACGRSPEGTTCSDDDACNGEETCDGAGACVAGEALTCDDGLDCNGEEVCDPELGCLAGEPLCDDGDECTQDTCDEETGECSYSPISDCPEGEEPPDENSDGGCSCSTEGTGASSSGVLMLAVVLFGLLLRR